MSYCTMVLNDEYLPGAKVLAYQLKQLDHKHPIDCLVTKTLSQSALDSLNAYFDKLWFVDEIKAEDSMQLSQLNRPELNIALTKFHCWNLPYERVVYLDADTLPLRPISELFELNFKSKLTVFAAPDSGWPDMFNSGVMALKPDLQVFEKLLNFEGASIDGSDQGVLNMVLEWERLPFLFNTTVNSAYEYKPAYERFKNDVRVLHFVGANKPWRNNASVEAQRWWTVEREREQREQLDHHHQDHQDADHHQDHQDHHVDHPTQAPHYIVKDPQMENPQVAYSEDKLIQPDPERWDATVHPPFSNTKPEAELLPVEMENLKLDSHEFPEFGPSLVKFPFEGRNPKPERVFPKRI